MKILINFSEIQSLVRSKTGRELALLVMNERTVKTESKVSVKVPFLGKIEKSIGVNVSVEKIEGTNVYLEYESGMGTDMIISGLFAFLSSSPTMKMAEKVRGNGIIVHLSEIKEARKILDMVELTNIIFHNDCVAIEGKLK